MATLKELALQVPDTTPSLSFLRFEGNLGKATVDFPAETKFEEFVSKSGTKIKRAQVEINGKKGYITAFDLQKLANGAQSIAVGTGMVIKLTKDVITTKDKKTLEINVPSLLEAGVPHTDVKFVS